MDKLHFIYFTLLTLLIAVAFSIAEPDKESCTNIQVAQLEQYTLNEIFEQEDNDYFYSCSSRNRKAPVSSVPDRMTFSSSFSYLKYRKTTFTSYNTTLLSQSVLCIYRI